MDTLNKTDSFLNIDPTQVTTNGSCGEIVYNQETQMWEQREQKGTCKEQLAAAKNEIASLKAKLAETNTLNECEVLEKYLTPVSDLSGRITHYVIKSDLPCDNLPKTIRTDLNGNNSAIVVDK